MTAVKVCFKKRERKQSHVSFGLHYKSPGVDIPALKLSPLLCQSCWRHCRRGPPRNSGSSRSAWFKRWAEWASPPSLSPPLTLNHSLVFHPWLGHQCGVQACYLPCGINPGRLVACSGHAAMNGKSFLESSFKVIALPFSSGPAVCKRNVHETHRGTCWTAGSDSVGRGRILRVCISNKLPGLVLGTIKG